MTIKRGEPWGTTGPPPPGLELVSSDRELFELVNRVRCAEATIPPIGLLGGDLCRALGGAGDAARFRSGEVALLPVDLLRVELGDGDRTRTWRAAAHVVLRRGWWRGPLVAVLNSQFIGSWDVAPRAHPNDGRADLVEVDEHMPVSQRWQAWRRLPTGAHLPHPMIRARQAREFELPGFAGARLYLDGRRLEVGGLVEGVSLRVVVEPDAALVCV